jgi:hypothetical protein
VRPFSTGEGTAGAGRRQCHAGGKSGTNQALVLIADFAAAIPAALICGGITGYSVGVAGEQVAESESGWLLGIPAALAVTIGLLVLAARLLVKRVP